MSCPINSCHIALFFDYGNKDTDFFLISKFFLTFFVLFFIACNHTYIFRLSRVPPFSGGRVPLMCGPVVVVCPDGFHTHAHTYTRARGFLDHKFLDITIIFRPLRNF